MKQTAVEWLQEQLNPDMKTMQGVIIQELLEQAKQMEKEQIEDAYDNGFVNGFDDGKYDDEPKFGNSEKYYEITYGGNK